MVSQSHSVRRGGDDVYRFFSDGAPCHSLWRRRMDQEIRERPAANPEKGKHQDMHMV